MDYRKLNSKIVKDSMPLPNVNDSLDALGGKKWFPCLDLRQGFFQVSVAEESRSKTVFQAAVCGNLKSCR